MYLFGSLSSLDMCNPYSFFGTIDQIPAAGLPTATSQSRRGLDALQMQRASDDGSKECRMENFGQIERKVKRMYVKRAERMDQNIDPSEVVAHVKTQKFPTKLFKLANECKSGAIAWSSCGKVIVLDYLLFQRQYLNELAFKTSNISSFIRQLNLYGFRKVSNKLNNHLHYFRHTSFKKDHEHLLCQVLRMLPASGAGKWQRTESQSKPSPFALVQASKVPESSSIETTLAECWTLAENVSKLDWSWCRSCSDRLSTALIVHNTCTSR